MDAVNTATDISGWYSCRDTSSSSEDTLAKAFLQAKSMLKNVLKPKDFELLFPANSADPRYVSNHTISDVQRSLRDAQARYEDRTGILTNDKLEAVAPAATATSGKATAKARFWLTRLSERLVHYGNIFDVLVQIYPEYASLAWGTFKLLFVAIVNHAETASKLSKSISQIAECLPQHSLHLILYPTATMQQSVARLYAHILTFFVSSLKWYKHGRAVHAVQSIVQPWDLKFRNEYEAIAAEAEQIRRLADAAMKAEVRDTRLEVVQSAARWDAVKQEMSLLRAENQRLASIFETRFQVMEGSIYGMCQEIRLDLNSQRATLNRVHLNQMLSLPLWGSLPTSGESLRYCRSMRNRRRDQTKLPVPDIKRLELWASQQGNAVLLVDTYVSAAAKAFMVDFIDLVLDSQWPILWALRYGDYWNQSVNVTDIVRMLVLQTMQANANHLLNCSFPLTVEQLREAASIADWVAILDQLLARTGQAFIVIDTDLLAHATAYDRVGALEMLDALRRQLSSQVKIVIAASSVSHAYKEELEQADACIRVQTSRVLNQRKARRIQRSARRLYKR